MYLASRTCASSMAASTYAGLQRSFHISEEVAILTVSLFVLGLGVGPLFLGPVSEFVGRRIVYLWSLLAFLRKLPRTVALDWVTPLILLTVFTIPVALANNARKEFDDCSTCLSTYSPREKPYT
jgi:MFS family permease